MTDADLKAHAKEIAQYVLSEWGGQLTPDDRAQLADTALIMLENGTIGRHDSMMTAGLRLMRKMEMDQ